MSLLLESRVPTSSQTASKYMKNKITHSQQQKIWNEEHRKPKVLLQMNSQEVSGGVVKFLDYIKNQNKSLSSKLTGIEMGCGKGRNVIWLAEQKESKEVYGFDFSESAIKVARKRAEEKGVKSKVKFFVGDATKPWKFKNDTFDYGIDCFASTDIETIEGRIFAIKETHRTLKPGGYFFVYALTPDDEFHKQMIKKSPAEEKNAFYHTTGKFEKTFNKEELKEMYVNFKVIKWQRVNKTTLFFGKEYKCKHFWLILQKPYITN